MKPKKVNTNPNLIDTKTIGDAKLMAEFKYAVTIWTRDMTPGAKNEALEFANKTIPLPAGEVVNA